MKTKDSGMIEKVKNATVAAIKGSGDGADLGHAAKGIMVGVLRGTKETSIEVLHTVSHTAEVAVRDTAEIGGDLEAATTGLVAGAVEGAKELGVSVEDAAAAAAAGALKAAGAVGSTAVETVRKAVTKPINGVKVALKEPEIAMSKN